MPSAGGRAVDGSGMEVVDMSREVWSLERRVGRVSAVVMVEMGASWWCEAFVEEVLLERRRCSGVRG